MENKNEDKKPDVKIINTSFIDYLGDLYEQVYDKDTGETFFIKYNKFSKEIEEVVQQVEVDDIVYKPINNDFVKKEFILLPSETREYDNLPALLQSIQKYIHKYLDITEFGEILSSYYVLLSWIYDNFETIPYLRFIGDYGTGKSRALKVIGSICYKPIFAGGAITPSPIFRLIEQFKGTLVIDEADFSFSDHFAEIVKILNCGYQKGLPVLRTEGDRNKVPTAFDVFSPKLIATRESFKDLALESRCLTEQMKGNPRRDIPYQLPKKFYKETLELRNMLLMFRFKYYGEIEIDENLRIEGVEARINQIIMSILAIIEDENERKRLRDFIIKYDRDLKNKRADEIPALILSIITKLNHNGIVLTYKNIAGEVNKERDEKNGEFKITPAKIGRINNSVLDFEHKLINGRTQLIWNEEIAKNLCNRYGLNFEEIKDGSLSRDTEEDLTSSTNSTELVI